MLKFASAQIMTKTLVPTDMGRRELRRFAHKHHFSYDVRPGYLYVRSRAISSRCNDNFDEFPAEELEKSYRSFVGKPVFVNHVNHDHKRARGVIIDAVLHKDSNRDGSKDWWVEVLQEVDALRFPRLAKEILAGNIARTSMGCDVSHSICSACGNKATTPAEYCQHIPAAKGQRLYRTTASGKKEGVLIRETCFGLKFFENSLLVEPPADPTAFFTGVDSSGLDKAASKTANKDPRFAEVGLKQDDDGHFVTTHRARSKSYPSPEDIPQSVVDRIAATGARSRQPGPGQGELFDASPLHVEPEKSYVGTWKDKEGPLTWDEIGSRWPHVYGDREVHGEDAAGADGDGIGWAANHLAHATPDDPDADNHGSYDMEFHSERVHPSRIDYARHGGGDGRVQHAREGYRSNPDEVPPVVLVHRHGVYQVADGHHRAEAAHTEGKTVRAYVAYSPYQDEPSSDGDKAPYHGATPTPPRHTAARETLTGLFAEAINQEGGELPAFPWDKAPKINLPLTQKGWDDPRRKDMYDAIQDRDMTKENDPKPGPYQGLMDKLPNYADQEMSNPHGMGASDVGRTSIPPDKYAGDKKEQWARHRWDNVKWPSWTNHNERPSTPEEQLSSKRNIRNRWSKTWKKPLACDHGACPPWACGGDAHTPTESATPLDPFEQFMKDDDGSKEASLHEAAAKPKFVPGPAPTEPAPAGADHENKPGPVVHDGSKYHVVDQTGRAMQWTHDSDGVKIHPGHDTFDEAEKARKKINSFRAPNEWGKGADPATHPFYVEHPVHHKHVVDAWNEASPDEMAYGMHWYPHAHEIGKAAALRHPDLEMRHAKAVVSGDPAAKARTEAEAAHKGAGLLSSYSPQVNWWDNQNHALSSFLRGKAVGPGDGNVGMVNNTTKATAQRIMNGEHHQNVLGGDKTRKFAKLIENKGTSRDVVVDRHAIAVATGGKMLPAEMKEQDNETPEETKIRKAHNMKHTFPTNSKNLYAHAENAFHEGTDKINEHRASQGLAPVTPSQVQAVTWLVQQRKNENQNTVTNARNRWREKGREHLPKLHEDGNYHLSRKKTAFGETKAPEDVDTLREDSCPVCGDREAYDGAMCNVCGYITPPKLFQDPDLEMARSMDLRKDMAEFNGAPGQPVDPNALDENGNPIPGAAPDEQQPGTLPGEVQAEVQPGGDPMGQPMPGADGQIPDEMGQPVDPSLLGPDGQPLQQGQQAIAPDGTPLPAPGQQPMLGPDGMPLGPQQLPPDAMTSDGKPFTPGPNMPMRPGEPQGPEELAGPQDLDEDGQLPNPGAGQGVPGTPGDGVPDLSCPACGFQADATAPVTVDMDTANMPDAGVATPDGVQAGDVCPQCGGGLLVSPAEEQGQVPVPVPGQPAPMNR